MSRLVVQTSCGCWGGSRVGGRLCRSEEGSEDSAVNDLGSLETQEGKWMWDQYEGGQTSTRGPFALTHLGLRQHEVENDDSLNGVVEGEPVEDAVGGDVSVPVCQRRPA